MKLFNHGNLAVDIQRKTQPATKTVQKKKVVHRYGITGKEKLAYFIAIMIIVSISLMVLARYSEVSKQNYQIVEIQQQMKETQEENNQLKLQIDALSDPERIKAVANEMGLAQHEGSVKVYK